MQRQFIMVEGVNIYANLYDTDQLSVIRGSSFIYKHAIEYIKDHFKDTLEALSTGASSGLFMVKAPHHDNDLTDKINNELTQHPDFSLVTFQVASCQADNVNTAKTTLLNKLRFQQLTTVTTQPDNINTDYPEMLQTCELSGTRIASRIVRILQGRERKVSASVDARWRYGKTEKTGFYKPLVADETNRKLADYTLADNIEQLCADPNDPPDEQGNKSPHNDKPLRALIYPKLAGKMAVIYIDGNQFGKIQDQFINTAQQHLDPIAAQQKFDESIQALRNEFLDERLNDLISEENNSDPIPPNASGNKVLRLETLLWGGDEVLFIMPAWKGFDFLQQFFNYDWQLALPDNAGTIPLTHAAGIVFCQAKTPIRIISDISRHLAENVKEHYGRDKNGWDYMALESIDYPTTNDITAYFHSRYRKINLPGQRPVGLPAIGNWNEQRRELQTLLSERKLPVRQLYEIRKALIAEKEPTTGTQQVPTTETTHTWETTLNMTEAELSTASAQEIAEYRMVQVSGNKNWWLNAWPDMAEAWFGVAMDDSNQRGWLWLHLLELWDYLCPEPETQEEQP